MKNPLTFRQHVLLWLACSAIFFEAFDVSVVNLALPLLAADLRLPLAAVQWVQTIYLMSFGGFLLLGGRLCDHAGSRQVFLTGMLLFGGASAVGACSHHLGWLLPARAGQGIGAALAMPAGISLLSVHFTEPRQQQSAFGIFGAFAAIGFAGGLALGGVIASCLDWHWIFGMNVPVIAAVVVAGHRWIPSNKPAKGGTLQTPMAIWLTATLLMLSYGVHESANGGWKAAICLPAALLSGIALRRTDRRQVRPFFGRGIYTGPDHYRTLGAFALLGTAFLPFVFISAFSLQALQGWDTLTTGLLLFPYSIGSALVSRLLLPRLYQAIGVWRTGILSIACLLAGDLLLAAGIWHHLLVCWLIALLLVNSLSIAIGYPAFTVLSLEGVPADKQGIAAGLQSSLYTMGSGLGLSLTGLCMQAFPGGGWGGKGMAGGVMAHRAGGTGAVPLLACCGIIGGLCLAAVLLLVRKPKNTYLCPPI
jgi:MFS family permease